MDELTYLAQTDLFRDMPRRHLKRIARLVQLRKAEKGEELTREGARGRDFFIVFSGTASVTAGSKKIGSLAAGDSFGELAILSNRPRSATVTATSLMELGVVGSDEFDAVLRSEPAIALFLLQKMASRLEELIAQVGAKRAPAPKTKTRSRP